MASFFRKLSQTAKPADVPATATPTVSVTPTRLLTEALSPRELVLKSIGSTEVTIQFSLPPTSCSASNPVDLLVLVRPAKVYKSAMEAANKVTQELSKANMEFNMQNLKNTQKPAAEKHDAMLAHHKRVNDFRRAQDEVWKEYALKCKELFQLDQGTHTYYDGWFAFDSASDQFMGFEGFTTCPGVPLKLTNEMNRITVHHLASNYFFECALCAKNSAVGTEILEENAVMWSPLSTGLTFSTKSAPWQSALEKAGLRQLIELFSERGLDSFESWLPLMDNTNLKMDMGIDSAMENILQDILSQQGVITPVEQAKIDRERNEMGGFVANLLAELESTKLSLQMGDPVISTTGPKRFGVVAASSANGGGVVSIRWEDPKSKDPTNSVLEPNWKVTNLARSQFTLFLSHAQAEAQNQVAHLSVLLRDRDAKIWFDMDSERLEAKDMVRGIANSQTFLIYLTKTYLDRYFCRMEISIGKALKKPLIIVFEPDERHGGTSDYVQLVNLCTKKFPEFRDYLLSSEAIPMARRAFQRRAVVDEVCKRAGFKSGTTTTTATTPTTTATVSSSTTSSDALEELRNAILDLRMENMDLRAELKELREMVGSRE